MARACSTREERVVARRRRERFGRGWRGSVQTCKSFSSSVHTQRARPAAARAKVSELRRREEAKRGCKRTTATTDSLEGGLGRHC